MWWYVCLNFILDILSTLPFKSSFSLFNKNHPIQQMTSQSDSTNDVIIRFNKWRHSPIQQMTSQFDSTNDVIIRFNKWRHSPIQQMTSRSLAFVKICPLTATPPRAEIRPWVRGTVTVALTVVRFLLCFIIYFSHDVCWCPSIVFLNCNITSF